MKIEIELSDDCLRNILITAVEGGSNYWAEFKGVSYKKMTAKVRDVEGGKKTFKLITRESLANGIKAALASKNPNLARIAGEAIGGDILDVDQADVILQFAVFGECIYG
jgi:hypothetical protein